jgi:hypothetical protein
MCENWSVKLMEEHWLRVFRNRVLNVIFGMKRDEIAGSSRKLHNEELHNFYPSPSIIRMIKSKRIRWSGHVAWIREKRIPEGKRAVGWPRRSLVDNIKIDVREIGRGVDRIDLAQDKDKSGVFWIRQWASAFQKILGSSWVAVQEAASLGGLSCMQLVS